jgi:hypothetical protein
MRLRCCGWGVLLETARLSACFLGVVGGACLCTITCCCEHTPALIMHFEFAVSHHCPDPMTGCEVAVRAWPLDVWWASWLPTWLVGWVAGCQKGLMSVVDCRYQADSALCAYMFAFVLCPSCGLARFMNTVLLHAWQWGPEAVHTE